MKKYLLLEKQKKEIEAEQTKIRDTFKMLAKGKKNQILNFGYAGVVIQQAVRESLDKKKVKDLLGELQYQSVVKISKYEMLRVYTDPKRWQGYLNKFTKQVTAVIKEDNAK
jgi:hypothetical protein